MRLGKHILIDGSDVDAKVLDDRNLVEDTARAAVEAMGATKLATINHKFEPQGVTVVIVIAESHVSIHTWPELGAYAADVFTCGEVDPMPAATAITTALGGVASVTHIERRVSR